ncbi:partial thiamine-phosphate pyrophosphorylase, partial [Methylophilaceae bacterium]
IVAIGGITADTALPVLEAGAASVAIISDILLADDMQGRTEEIISRIRPLLEKR